MKRHIPFSSIEQFRSVVHNVKHVTSYLGKDTDGNAIRDYTIPLPILKFEGTVKCHGTNSAIVSDGSEIWYQSRENLIEPGKDNAGFAMFAHANKEIFENILKVIGSIVYLQGTVAIFGEWCGGSIQKGMAISQLPKMFIVFNIATCDDSNNKFWLTKEKVVSIMSCNTHSNIKCIYDFPHWYMDIDFNKPHEYQNKLSEMTLTVETECPVGKRLGVTGIGEGIVWKCISDKFTDSGYWFKVKGEKHSEKSKVKTLAPVNTEKINNIIALVEKITPEWRLEQVMQSTFNTLNDGKIDITGMGTFIKNTMADVLKEELDTIAASGFTTKDITGQVAKKCKEYLTKQLNDLTKGL